MTRRRETPPRTTRQPDATPDPAPPEPTTGLAEAWRQVAGALAEPALVDEASSLDVPMLEEPTHLPGQRRAKFSPLAYYALSRVERLDVDAEDEGLWLEEAACPKLTPIGIEFGGQTFWHPHMQDLVAGLPTTRGHHMRLRYNRAHLARGVLREVILCERDPQGRVTERLRLAPRQQALQEVDLNQTLRERQRFISVLLAKVNAAHQTRIALEHGTAAIERLRDEQTARARRQRRTPQPAIVARPILSESRREAEAREANARTAALAEHLGRAQPGADDDGVMPAADHAPQPAARGPIRSADDGPGMVSDQEAPVGSVARSTKGRTRSTTARRKRAATPKQRTRTATHRQPPSGEVSPPAATSPSAPSQQSLIDELGGASGFFTPDDD